MTSVHLNGHHRKTLASIFNHPTSHNVEWHDVLSLLDHVGSTTARHGGGYDVTIGSDRFIVDRPHGHDMSADELRHLRAFLTKAGMSSTAAATEPALEAQHEGKSCIVLIDHHHARLFALDDEGRDSSAPTIIVPDDADGAARRLEHRQGNDDHDGGHAAEEIGFYERVSAHLATSQRIVVLSDGKGRSSAGEYLIGYLKRHHPDIAGNIVATERVDISHLSDGEIVTAGVALLATKSAVLQTAE